MKKILVAVLLTVSTNSFAELMDYADIIDVRENYRNVTRRSCDQAPVQYQNQPQSENSYGGAIIGGIAGGLLGNQVGGGNGRTAATAAGAAVGAITGYNLENRQRQPQQYQQICTDYNERLNDGYMVTYRYRGMQETVRMNTPPRSNRITVKIIPVLQ